MNKKWAKSGQKLFILAFLSQKSFKNLLKGKRFVLILLIGGNFEPTREKQKEIE